MKLPISLTRSPLREPDTDTETETETKTGTDVNLFESVTDDQTFDFRSSRFRSDAQALARTTGRSLAACRQDLFIAEGDMALAFEWLMSGYDGPTDDPVVH